MSFFACDEITHSTQLQFINGLTIFQCSSSFVYDNISHYDGDYDKSSNTQ